MARQGLLLMQTAGGWSISTTDRGASDNWGECAPVELAERSAAFAARVGTLPAPVVLAVGSQSVLSATFEMSAADQGDRRTLCYELESWLPVAAEDVIADFIRAGEQVLGVCIDIKTWLPMITALESSGLRVQTISPGGLLALQALRNEVAWDTDAIVIWHDQAETDLYRFRGERPITWQHFSDTPREISRQLAVESQSGDQIARVVAINATDELDAAIAELRPPNISLSSQRAKTIQELAADQADAIIRGIESPWIELRRDALATADPYRQLSGSLRLLAAAAAIFLITLSAVFFLVSRRNEVMLAQLSREQTESFREAFPGSRPPAAIVGRMKSEQAKLRGSHSAASDVKIPVPALRVLLALLQALPANERFVVRELRIEDGTIDLDVDLLQHASVNQFVQALESHGFSVTAPATARRDDNFVSCRIFGELPTSLAETTPEARHDP